MKDYKFTLFLLAFGVLVVGVLVWNPESLFNGSDQERAPIVNAATPGVVSGELCTMDYAFLIDQKSRHLDLSAQVGVGRSEGYCDVGNVIGFTVVRTSGIVKTYTKDGVPHLTAPVDSLKPNELRKDAEVVLEWNGQQLRRTVWVYNGDAH